MQDVFGKPLHVFVDLSLRDIKERVGLRENVARVHPRFLNSLELTHTDWAFGGIAELIDNARDAGATRLVSCLIHKLSTSSFSQL